MATNEPLPPVTIVDRVGALRCAIAAVNIESIANGQYMNMPLAHGCLAGAADRTNERDSAKAFVGYYRECVHCLEHGINEARLHQRYNAVLGCFREWEELVDLVTAAHDTWKTA